MLAALLIMRSTVFLATYFVDNGEAGAYLAVSQDGYRFEPIVSPNRPILVPTVGKDRLMRDPCLLAGPDGTWHLTWTTGWSDREIGIAHSKDLVHWTGVESVPVMKDFPDAGNAWAPEIAYHAATQRYMIFWSSTRTGAFLETAQPNGDSLGKVALNHRFYATTTADFRHYSPTRLLWDPGFSCIDATVIATANGWRMFAKDETKVPTPAKFLFVADAPRIDGPYRLTSRRITGEFWAEGPTAVADGETTRVYFDRYTEGRWGAVESRNGLDWTDVSDRVEMVKGARHGTVLRVDSAVVEAVRAALRR